MKLAYTVGTPEVHSFPFGWVGGSERALGCLADIGYDGLELQTRDTAAFDWDRFRAQVRGAGLEIAAVSTGAVGTDKLRLVDPDADVRRQAIARCLGAVRLAHEYDAHASVGGVRGWLRSAPDAATGWEWFEQALGQITRVAEPLGVRILIEPMARHVSDFLNSFDETAAFIRRFGSPILGFEGDLFHMSAEEKSIPAALVSGCLAGYLGHVQLSDSGHCVPGDGDVHWVDVIETLRALGYDGWLSMEIEQKPDSATCARRAHDFIRPLLGSN